MQDINILLRALQRKESEKKKEKKEKYIIYPYDTQYFKVWIHKSQQQMRISLT